ncbi:quinolinate synthase NadA [Halobacteriovorax vibrionivorans]|uniref:Quinolinate synthase n=1 Tax=Halobacteriovorax vibrionivorans TaxID=2152716 RepID=A0ABY0III5_9BACT|nr:MULTISPECIES: quinolinate synthase NadA [Halobacteriovorax]RZF22769.1 quinolinate synthase NadA [Halobacteriovorax vibrionivorans]TGD46205.1 quinolinate synthase NadA [Halobacteriovorax sp. Y22]
MLDLFGKEEVHRPIISQEELSDEEVLVELRKIKEELKDEVVVLGHHYQQDDVIEFADYKGDSLKLAQDAALLKDKPYIIFCGVHFMAETADMLTGDDQHVILPDMQAGCSMADMANREEIDKAWDFMRKSTNDKIIPITYINCAATLKSFVGENDGTICTSSNAQNIIKWAFDQGQKLLFFPDQHLGRNTCHDLGISLDEMVVYNPNMLNGGLTSEQIDKAKVILWYGFCSVHQGFTATQVEQIKKEKPDTTVIVHPECNFEVVQAAHDNGSTAYIINKIKEAPAGSKFAVGTEINLVNRLANDFPDKEITSLSPYQCLCTTMYRVRPRWLLASFRAIKENKPINIIKVDDKTKEYSLKALNKMLELSK